MSWNATGRCDAMEEQDEAVASRSPISRLPSSACELSVNLSWFKIWGLAVVKRSCAEGNVCLQNQSEYWKDEWYEKGYSGLEGNSCMRPAGEGQTKAQYIQANKPLPGMSISITCERRTAASQVKLIRHSLNEAIGAGTRDHACIHRRIRASTWAWTLVFYLPAVEETLDGG
jgi:hypothetical protein